MATIQDGDLYFSEVLHNTEWVEADTDTKTRALKTSQRQLSKIVPSDFVLPSEAIFEQAILLLRVDDGFLQAQLGVSQTSVAGISVSYNIKEVKLINGMPISQMALAIIKENGGTVKGSNRVGGYWL
jgi:hypothetical protein